jgi:putative oxidoreductase
MDETQREIWSSVGLLILRLGFGGYLMTSGWVKVQMMLGGQWSAIGDPIGIGSTASLILVTFAEFVCAVLVIIGLGTRYASIPIVISMGVAAFVAHGSDPWTMTTAAMRFFNGESQSWASKQPALMFLIVFLGLIFTGAGRFSLDHLIAKRKQSPTSSRS